MALCLKPLEMRTNTYLYLEDSGIIDKEARTKIFVERKVAIIDPENQLKFENGIYTAKLMFLFK
jgi:DNA-binding transcriptional regulator YhcF (GntR family)